VIDARDVDVSVRLVKDEERLSVKVSVRLSRYEARALWKLRTHGLPEGARPRTSTEVIVHALLAAAAERAHKG
jgi:hypothetical protein